MTRDYNDPCIYAYANVLRQLLSFPVKNSLGIIRIHSGYIPTLDQPTYSTYSTQIDSNQENIYFVEVLV